MSVKTFTGTSREGQKIGNVKNVLIQLKRNMCTVKVYLDKKIFTVDAVLKRGNDKYVAHPKVHGKGTFRRKDGFWRCWL